MMLLVSDTSDLRHSAVVQWHADAEWLNMRLAELRSAAVQERLSKGFVTAKIEDPGLAHSSSAMTYMVQQTAMVKMCRDAVIAPTSQV